MFDPRGMIGGIHVGSHQTLLHAKYSSSSCGFREDFSHYKPIADIDTSGQFGPQGWQDLYRRIPKLLENIESLGLVVSGKKIYLVFFSTVRLWELCVAMETTFYTICFKTQCSQSLNLMMININLI